MDWSMVELPETRLEDIYKSVDDEQYATMEQIYKEFEEGNILYVDVNLHIIVEHFSELIQLGQSRFLTIYYLSEDDMYVGVYESY